MRTLTAFTVGLASVALGVLLASPVAGSPVTPEPSASARRPVALAQVVAPPVRGAPPPRMSYPAAPVPPPPPAPPVERVEPRRGFVWIDGNYDWRDGRYVWVPGHFEPARPGRRWHDGHWEWKGNHYAWARGFWTEVERVPEAAPPRYVVESPPPPPPPPQQAVPPPGGRPGYVWVPGEQDWRDGRYVVVEGHWEPVRHGEAWRAGHWDLDGDGDGRGRRVWHPGGWEHGEHGDHGDHGHRHGPPSPRGRGRNAALAISGRILARDGRPVPGVAVVLAGTSEGRTVTDGNGGYVFAVLTPGSYAVRPNDGRCSFGPDVVNLNNLGGSVVQNFSAACRGPW